MKDTTIEKLYWSPIGIVLIHTHEKFSSDKTPMWYFGLGVVHSIYLCAAMLLIKLL